MTLAELPGTVILLLLPIIILENSQRVNISYFGMHGHPTLGVALLLAHSELKSARGPG